MQDAVFWKHPETPVASSGTQFAASSSAPLVELPLTDSQDDCLAPSMVIQALRNSIINMHKANVPKANIGRQLNIHKTTVYRWIERENDCGNVNQRERPGRWRHTSKEQDGLIVDFARRHPLSNTTVTKREVGLQVSSQTIRRILHEADIHHFKPAKKPFVTESHRQEILSFALEYYKPLGDEFWKKVIFCDEKTFSSDERGSLLHCWLQRNIT
ncbi:uncharacterized protein [Macrobrachium rosenbergii]|uniref:uncharacterized protein n=1 Tax=Macrobrachium rosenbergii TaxID=79674 RepID=UPI0034D6D67B